MFPSNTAGRVPRPPTLLTSLLGGHQRTCGGLSVTLASGNTQFALIKDSEGPPALRKSFLCSPLEEGWAIANFFHASLEVSQLGGSYAQLFALLL